MPPAHGEPHEKEGRPDDSRTCHTHVWQHLAMHEERHCRTATSNTPPPTHTHIHAHPGSLARPARAAAHTVQVHHSSGLGAQVGKGSEHCCAAGLGVQAGRQVVFQKAREYQDVNIDVRHRPGKRGGREGGWLCHMAKNDGIRTVPWCCSPSPRVPDRTCGQRWPTQVMVQDPPCSKDWGPLPNLTCP